ncbi:hypothetical protein LPTSP4_23070 [Leptospira ryugenii]|uniref:Bacterial group 3 Ig-like protein n=1 Tax=Leptospira ryugenii TaxID=1917863 RepID=A0A2P2E1N1_9LEPT|nr:hypothetical protein [Leptospira ryugenii]GBF50780.1 hypothetical protein LPTSP4_23070 [Leptospira ryugenii]
MQAHKYTLAIVTLFLAGQLSAQTTEPKANTSTKDAAVKKTESTSEQVKTGADTAETKVKEILGEKKEATPAAPSSVGVANKEILFITSQTSFTLEAKDDSSAVDFIEWKPKNGEFRRFTQPIRISEEGMTEIHYRSVDKAGNAETPKVLVIYVDNTAPRVSLVPSEQFFFLDGVPFTSKNNSYAIIAEDKQTGVQSIQYSINSEAGKTYAEPIKLEKGGANVIKYSATDKSGNTSPESSLIISVDDVKPTVEIVPSLPLVDISGKSYAKKGNVFYVNAADKESGVKKVLVKLDAETEFRPYTEAIKVETQGEHILRAIAIDNVGNQSEIVELKFNVDLTPPSSIIQKADGAKVVEPAKSEPAKTETKP